MLIIPKIIKDKSPSCCYLNDRRNMMCVIKDLYDQMNLNYEFLSSGGIQEAVREYLDEKGITLPEEEVVDFDPATEDQVDSLFGD